MYASLKIERKRSTPWSRREFPAPWVARILGRDPAYGYRREFLRPVVDYSEMPHRLFFYYVLAPGLYEVFRVVSNREDRRYFTFANDDGTLTDYTMEEVEAWIKNTWG